MCFCLFVILFCIFGQFVILYYCIFGQFVFVFDGSGDRAGWWSVAKLDTSNKLQKANSQTTCFHNIILKLFMFSNLISRLFKIWFTKMNSNDVPFFKLQILNVLDSKLIFCTENPNKILSWVKKKNGLGEEFCRRSVSIQHRLQSNVN